MDVRPHIDIIPNGGLRHLFGITSPGSNPEELAIDKVSPVVEMSMGGHLKLNNTLKRAFVTNANALNSQVISANVLDYGNVGVPGMGTIFYQVGTNFRVLDWSIWVYVTNDTWRSTNSGRTFWLQQLITINGSEYCPVRQGPATINTNNPFMTYGSTGTWGDSVLHNLIVPAGAFLSVGLNCNCLVGGATSFNMGAVGNVELHSEIIGQEVPMGAVLPSFW